MSFNPVNIEAIRKAFENISDNKWKAGDAALAEVPAGTHGGDRKSEIKLVKTNLIEDLATEAGVSADALNDYRRTAAAWAPADRQPTVAFTVHRILNGHDNKEQVLADLVKKAKGQKVTQAYVMEKVKGWTPPVETVNITPEFKAAIAAEVLADPDLYDLNYAELSQAVERRHETLATRAGIKRDDVEPRGEMYGPTVGEVRAMHPELMQKPEREEGALAYYNRSCSSAGAGVIILRNDGIRDYDLDASEADIDELIGRGTMAQVAIAEFQKVLTEIKPGRKARKS